MLPAEPLYALVRPGQPPFCSLMRGDLLCAKNRNEERNKEAFPLIGFSKSRKDLNCECHN